MTIAKVERSQVDSRYCVYTPTSETLCPWWAVPMVWAWACCTSQEGKPNE